MIGKNIMTYPCSDVNKTTPYFKEYTPEKYQGTSYMNEYLFNVLDALQSSNVTFTDRNTMPAE